MGYKEDEIVMDVILSGNPNLPHALANYYNSFGMLERTLEVQSYFEKMYGLIRARDSHPGVHFRHVIGPNRDMSNKIVPVEYNEQEVETQMLEGRQDAKSSIATYKE